MVAPLPSRVSLATEGPPCFGRVQQEGCPLLPVCCVCTKPHRIIVSRRGRGNLESSFVMPPTPPPDVCAVWTAQTCATGPPSSVLPTRHHCLFRTSGFLPRAKSESFAPPGPSLRNSSFPLVWTIGVRSVHDGVLGGVLVILTTQRRFPSALAVCAPVLFLVCLPRPKNTLTRPPILPLHSCGFAPVLLLFSFSNVHWEGGEEGNDSPCSGSASASFISRPSFTVDATRDCRPFVNGR